MKSAPERPYDTNKLARSVVEEAIGEKDPAFLKGSKKTRKEIISIK